MDTPAIPNEKPAMMKDRKTGLIYDSRMLKHRNEFNPNHPEVPERISVAWDNLETKGLKQQCKILESREATKEEILLVHDEDHYKLLSSSVTMEKDDLFALGGCYSSIFVNNFSYEAAKVAAGCVLELTEQVVSGQVNNGVALVRPPGHHAECAFAMGFSLFNSIAVAAKHAVEKLGLKRVLIVDWDIHHGNGTQHMFYEDSRVLYFSMHRYDHGLFYPGQGDADPTYTGGQSAPGFNVNVAWNDDKMGDSEYLSAFHHILMPIAYEFNPELVMVSCGFDAAQGDPLGCYNVTPSGYAHMTHLLMSLAGGKLVYALEGGYSVSAISKSTNQVVATLLGEFPLPSLRPLHPCESAMTSITETGKAHTAHWKSLHIFADYNPTPPFPEVKSPVTVLSYPDPSKSGRGGPYNNLEEMKKLHLVDTNTPSADESKVASKESGTDSEKSGASSNMCGTNPLNATQQGIIETLGDIGHTVMYAVTPLTWCEHLSTHVKPLPPGGIDAHQCCETCGEKQEAWVCLDCYHAYCGRYVNQHMLDHQDTAGHKVVLSLADISVWCFECDSYLDNEVLHAAKNSVHLNKFGCNMGGSV